MMSMASNLPYPPDPTAAFSLRGRLIAAAALTVFLVGGIGFWAATARLDAAVIGSGSVLVKNDVQNVQHVDGGTLNQILVSTGDTVTAGQPVMILDTFDLETRIGMLSAQLMEAEARAARLAAERDGVEMVLPTTFDAADPEAVRILDGERRLMEENSLNRDVELTALDLQADQLRFDTEGQTARRQSLLEELALVEESFARFDKLMKAGSVEKSRLDEILRDLTRMRGEMGEINANLARNETRQTEITLERDRLMATAKADAHRELRALEPQITDLRQQLAAATQKKERAILRAPVAGIVNEVNASTLGEVIPPGKTLVTIVPSETELIIEFKISTTDIDAIQPGQKARLRFPSFNQRLTPEIDGVVDTIAAAAVIDPNTGLNYYTARAKATGNLDDLGTRGLVPGMPVEVYIPTQERVVLSYLVQPVVDQMNRAMREE
ncbi:MAG: HlyD family type I secretion periplasmic adaptor subunit [Rhodobacteraceae bacterium]|nr:HlyD family type I secretion periplasmic adaptor subunit [Paracoccaceae bacterium]